MGEEERDSVALRAAEAIFAQRAAFAGFIGELLEGGFSCMRIASMQGRIGDLQVSALAGLGTSGEDCVIFLF
jgi:hypothetical protein